MIAATLGEGGLAAQGKSPGTRAKAIALLRAELLKAKDYAAKQAGPADKRPSRDLHLEALARVTNREIPLLVTAHRVPDLLAALRVASEFGIKIVLDGASESYLVLEKIKAANVPVILHPTMARAAEETGNLSMETASVLKKAGIPFAIESGYESYVPKTRVVLWEAATRGRPRADPGSGAGGHHDRCGAPARRRQTRGLSRSRQGWGRRDLRR